MIRDLDLDLDRGQEGNRGARSRPLDHWLRIRQSQGDGPERDRVPIGRPAADRKVDVLRCR